MPFANEHAARLEDPGKYERFRRENDKFGAGIDAVWGILKGGDVELQAIRFDSSKFTAEEARKWCADHDHKPILFEPASEKRAMQIRLSKASHDPQMSSKDEGNGQITGYASVWDVVDAQGDIVRRGAFTKTIQERVSARKVPLMVRHFAHGGDTTEAIGEIAEAIEDDVGLFIVADLYGAVVAQETRAKIKASPNIYGMSIGYEVVQAKAIADTKGEMTTGKELTEVKLYEVTITAVPANEMTSASAKTDGPTPAVEIEGIKGRIEALEARISELAKKPEGTQAPAPSKDDGQAVKAAIHLLQERCRRQKRVLALIDSGSST